MILLKLFLFFWLFLICIRNLFSSSKIQNHFFQKKNLLLDLLIPVWSVFTPLPINSDLKIFYRDLYVSGEESELNEIVFYDSKSNFLIYKYQRERKFLYCIYRLLSISKNKDFLTKTSEYKSFKSFISYKNYSNDIKTRQIIIVRYFGYISKKKETLELIDYINYV